MSAGEVARQVRRNLWLRTRRLAPGATKFQSVVGAFPKLSDPNTAPKALRESLRVDTDAILAGRWRVFGGVQLQVDDPPRWHKDYLAGVDLATDKPAHKLDHRKLPRGADIKLIWEPSRWNQLVRLAQASYVLDDNRAGQKCIDWLNNWVETNPPLRGWNWTSALESGLRLIAFSWIDALLSHNAKLGNDLELLRKKILPAHAEFTWRCRSFGSSANNHIIGELAGLIIALARWPELEKHAAPLE